MSALSKALSRSHALVNSTYEHAVQNKALGLPIATDVASMGGFTNGLSRGGNRAMYTLFRSWTYSAIHALASEGASQNVNVAELSGTSIDADRSAMALTKSQMDRMPAQLQRKSPTQELELLPDHPLIDAIDQPNPIQYRWQFVYNFIANLNLTGWSYIVGGETEDGGMEFYSLPTTWIRPIHKDGPFSHFKIVNPNDPASDSDDSKDLLDRSNVAFAHLPNPADPLSALSPSQAQMLAIRTDDHIQTSQERYFENGIFPSVIVTVGKDPHPNVPAGIRPRLSGAQRRQVVGAIRKTMGGVANYGNPAIVDGLIEKIERLSATANEMGWTQSEKDTRTRILSAFGVHPYILGEAVNVGGHAQTFNIEKRFCKRVNAFLEMLSVVMTNFAGPMVGGDDKLVVWWDKCEAVDRSIQSIEMREGRKNNDISQNEYRCFLGLPPDADRNEQVIDKTTLPHIANLLIQLAQGALAPEQIVAMLKGLGVPTELAEDIAGDPNRMPVLDSTDTLEEAVRAMKKPVEVKLDPVVDRVVSSILLAGKGGTTLPGTAGLAESIKEASQLADRPVNITVNPTPVEVRNEIDVRPTPVQVEVTNDVSPTPVVINAPDVEVDINRDEPPRHAEIQHPDGTISKIELRD